MKIIWIILESAFNSNSKDDYRYSGVDLDPKWVSQWWLWQGKNAWDEKWIWLLINQITAALFQQITLALVDYCTNLE